MDEKSRPPIGAVILAAGMSTRMGEPKQLLHLGEKTLLEEVLASVEGAHMDQIVLVLGFAADAVQPHIKTANLKIVVNREYSQGMATSLRTGLAALDHEIAAALIVLADQPLVRSTTLNRIIDEYRTSQAQIVIPLYRGFRGNPVLLDRSVFPEVMALEGDIGCRAIFGAHVGGIAKVEVDDIGILVDIDSHDDLRSLRQFRESGQNEQTLVDAATREPRHTPLSVASKLLEPSDELIVVGSEPVALALAKLGEFLGFMVTIVDPLLTTSGGSETARLLNTLDLSHLPASSSRYAVIASRGRFDEEAVEEALNAGSKYVAVVASKKRGQELLHSLATRGMPQQKLAMVRVPAGLAIGAETPEEIAVSIMAEIIALRRKREG